MKKLNSKGFSHIEILIVTVVIVAVGAVGFYVFNRMQDKSSKAESSTESSMTPEQAAAEERAAVSMGLKTIDNQQGVLFTGCRISNAVREGVRIRIKNTSGKKRFAGFHIRGDIDPNKPLVMDNEGSVVRNYVTVNNGYPGSDGQDRYNVTYTIARNFKGTADPSIQMYVHAREDGTYKNMKFLQLPRCS